MQKNKSFLLGRKDEELEGLTKEQLIQLNKYQTRRFGRLIDKTKEYHAKLVKGQSFMKHGTPSATVSLMLRVADQAGEKTKKPKFIIEHITEEGKKVLGIPPGETKVTGQPLDQFIVNNQDMNVFFLDVIDKWSNMKNALKEKAKMKNGVKKAIAYDEEIRNLIADQGDIFSALTLKVGNNLVDALARAKIYPETSVKEKLVINLENPKIGLTLNSINDLFKRNELLTHIFEATHEINKADSKEEVFKKLSNWMASIGGGFSFIAIPEGEHLKIISHSENLEAYLKRNFGENYPLPRIPMGFGAMGKAAETLLPVSVTKEEMEKEQKQITSSGITPENYREITDFRKKLTFSDYHAQPLFVEGKNGEKILFAVAGVFKSTQFSDEKGYNKRFSDAQRHLFDMISASSTVKLEKQKIQDELLYLAYHDQLTGLGNRNHFAHFFTELLNHYENETNKQKKVFEGFTVNYVDANGMKVINDTLGHNIGDKFICHVAESVKTFANNKGFPTNLQWRMGGDEIVFISPTDKELSEEQMAEFTDILRNRLKKDQDIQAAISNIKDQDLGKNIQMAINGNLIGATIASDSFNKEKFMKMLNEGGELERFTKIADKKCITKKEENKIGRDNLHEQVMNAIKTGRV